MLKVKVNIKSISLIIKHLTEVKMHLSRAIFESD